MKDRKYVFLALAALATAASLMLAGCSAPEDSSASGSSPASAGDSSNSQSPEESSPLLGEFTANDLEGNEVDQSILEDHKLTMVNVWATFCGPCLNEMPDLGALHTENADKGFQVVGVVIDVLNRDGALNQEQVDLAAEIVGKTGADYLHLLPSDDLIVALLGNVSAVPTTVFVDESGNLVGEVQLGARSKEQWQEMIDQLLEQVSGEDA